MGHEDRGSWDWEQTPQPLEPKELKELKKLTAPCSNMAHKRYNMLGCSECSVPQRQGVEK